MEVPMSIIFTQPYEKDNPNDDDERDFNEEERYQQTPQYVIDSLPRYTVRPNGAYSQQDCSCGICYCKYRTGDKIICLPCQHNFHDYCIENWLKWVKSTCPVDKKSIIRRQYIDELKEERRNRLLDAENERNCSVSHNERDLLICTDEKIHLIDGTVKRITKKKQQSPKVPQSGSPRNYSPKFLPPVCLKEPVKSDLNHIESGITQSTKSKTISPKKQNASAIEKNDGLKSNAMNSGYSSIFISDSNKKLRESVDAIRKSLKTGGQITKKCRSPQKFHEAVETIVSKLSSPSTCLTNVPEKQNSIGYLGKVRSISPSRNKDIERHLSLRGIMGKRSLTFGDILEIENEVSSGWIYKMDKRAAFDRKGLKKLL